MKISTKGRYSLRMLLDLAMNQSEGYIALKDIAKRQNISKKYLEQIVAAECTVGEILRLTEGSLVPVSCLENDCNQCFMAAECMTLPIWEGLYKVITDYLDNITLQDIIDNNPAINGDDYCI